MAKLTGFEVDSFDEEAFEPLKLNRDVARGKALHMADVHNLVDALDDLGFYDKGRQGKPPLAQESLFKAIEDFQADNGLKIDGVIKRDGPTVAAINVARPKVGSRSRATDHHSPSLAGDEGPAWHELWREQLSRAEPQGAGAAFDLLAQLDQATIGRPSVRALPVQSLLPRRRNNATPPSFANDNYSNYAAPRIRPVEIQPQLFVDPPGGGRSVGRGGASRRALSPDRSAAPSLAPRPQTPGTVGRINEPDRNRSIASPGSETGRPRGMELSRQQRDRIGSVVDRFLSSIGDRPPHQALEILGQAVRRAFVGASTQGDNRGSANTVAANREAARICIEEIAREIGGDAARYLHRGGSLRGGSLTDDYLEEDSLYLQGEPRPDGRHFVRPDITFGPPESQDRPGEIWYGLNTATANRQGQIVAREALAEALIAEVLGADMVDAIAKPRAGDAEDWERFRRETRERCRRVTPLIAERWRQWMRDNGFNDTAPPYLRSSQPAQRPRANSAAEPSE